jgi:hypothetical protein
MAYKAYSELEGNDIKTAVFVGYLILFSDLK